MQEPTNHVEQAPEVALENDGIDAAVIPDAVRHISAVQMMLAILLVLVIIFCLSLGKTLIVPLVLASFVGLGLNPLVAAASNMHIPRAVSALLVMLALTGGLVGAVTLLTPPAVEWLQQAPRAIRNVAPKLKPLTRKLNEANRATQSLVGTTQTHTAAPSSKPTFDIWDVLSVTPRILVFSMTVGLLVFFFLIYGDRMLLKLVEVSPSFSSKKHVVTIVRKIQDEISRYVFTAASINFGLGAATAATLWALGMPDPMLWGGLAALANFVPYVGAVSMTLLLSVVGFMHFHVLAQALTPAVCFALLTAVEGNVVTPLIMGRRMRLSPVAILIWLLIWGWLWGIAGVLLAVPMLTSLKLIAERVEGWQWMAHLVGR